MNTEKSGITLKNLGKSCKIMKYLRHMIFQDFYNLDRVLYPFLPVAPQHRGASFVPKWRSEEINESK